MIDEKIKEQPGGLPAVPPPLTTKDKLRAAWARLQCSSLLRSHRFQTRTRHHMEGLGALVCAIPLARQLGDWLYALGFTGEYTLIRAGRTIRAAALWLAAAFLRGWNNVVDTAFPGARTVLGELFGPVYVFCRGVRNIWVYGDEVRREQGFWAGIVADVRYLGRGAVRYGGLLPRMVAYLLPLGALAVLVAVVQIMVGRPYTLAVEVNGITVGNVANETVFDAAREDVLQRVNYAGTTGDTEVTIEPTYRLAITSDVLDEGQMANAILSAVSDEISEGTALYLDGELTAVCAEGSQLQLYLSSLLEPYEDPDDPNVSVSFNREVTVEQGLYLTGSFMDYADVVALLSGVRQAERVYTVVAGDSISLIATKNNLTTAELCELNGITTDTAIFPGDELIVTREEAMLEVQITRTVSWTEEIPFSTKQTQSSDYAFGTTRTVQEGENGVRTITAENVYATDGTMLSQTILSSEITKEPVDREIVVGTKLPSGSVAQVGNGTFIWPVPQYTGCSRWYSSSHKGVDINAPAGTPIYASASGVVTKAGYERAGAGTGYGYSLIIDHGNGYSTLYAHCLSLSVSAGQAVRQGQLIGYVGSTGRSTGNHCHFEIRHNGRYLPPQNYFQSYYR
mgnify:FL=1